MRIEGTIVQGKRLGRTIGFPTANLLPDCQWRFDETGVWAAWFYTDGERYGCMVNIGRHPTVPEGPATIEAHILDYSGDLYGKRAAIETVEYLRGEIKFADVDQLRTQLALDKARTAHILLKESIDCRTEEASRG